MIAWISRTLGAARSWLAAQVVLWRLVGVAAAGAVLIAVVVVLPTWQVYWAFEAGLDSERQVLEDQYRRTVVQIVGGLALLTGLYLTYRRIRATEEGQITERFTRAIEQLASEKLEIRLGGIYALERIAWDSRRDYRTCMQVLCAFVRHQKPTEHEELVGIVSPEVEAVLAVVKRRNRKWDKGERVIDLSGAHLKGASLAKARLENANLWAANLHQADLQGAHLEGALLGEANLRYVFLGGAHLQGADLEHSELRTSNEWNLAGARFDGAELSEARLRGADLSRTKGLTQRQIQEAEGDETTILPEGLTHPIHWDE